MFSDRFVMAFSMRVSSCICSNNQNYFLSNDTSESCNYHNFQTLLPLSFSSLRASVVQLTSFLVEHDSNWFATRTRPTLSNQVNSNGTSSVANSFCHEKTESVEQTVVWFSVKCAALLCPFKMSNRF